MKTDGSFIGYKEKPQDVDLPYPLNNFSVASKLIIIVDSPCIDLFAWPYVSDILVYLRSLLKSLGLYLIEKFLAFMEFQLFSIGIIDNMFSYIMNSLIFFIVSTWMW